MSPREPLWWHGVPWGTTAPIVDVAEREKTFELTAEVPGVDTQDVEVKISNDTLSIRGEKQEAKKQRGTDYRLRERHFSPFERQFALSADIDLNKIEATLKNGLLTVTLPKKPEAQKPTRRIEIKGD